MTEEHTSPVPEEDVQQDPTSDVGEMSQWKLIWLRFRRNRLAMGGVALLIVMYLLVGFAGFVAPNSFQTQNLDFIFGPPMPLALDGLKPHTYAVSTELDQENFKWVFVVDRETKVPIEFFVRGDTYSLLGRETDLHLFGLPDGARLYLWGTDSLGRDMFSRTLQGGTVSMTVGLVGIALTIFLGSVLGTVSGYFGGFIDDAMQRMVEVIQSFPTIPLWAALAAALPNISETFTMLHRYLLITVILSLVNWTGLARQLRAKVMSYREADFTSAALVAGASNARIIFVHMLPNAASHIIVVAAMSIPSMILGETALSFLGLGILPPMVSWGSLLRDAQQVATVVQHPWLILPGVGVILTVLGFSVLGDGLRDAVDPYSI